MNTRILYIPAAGCRVAENVSFLAHQLPPLNIPRFWFPDAFRSLVKNVGRIALVGLPARRPFSGA